MVDWLAFWVLLTYSVHCGLLSDPSTLDDMFFLTTASDANICQYTTEKNVTGSLDDTTCGDFRCLSYYRCIVFLDPTWLVVWNMFYFSFYIWDVILPIDELHHFSRWLLHHQPATHKISI
jgi:hypothetical protein